jgi:TPR repeat protein
MSIGDEMTNQPHSHVSNATQAFERGDYETAVFEFKLGVEGGNCEAKIWLAEIYLSGKGADIDGLKAEALLQEVISDSDAPKLVALALNNLSALYVTGSKGVPSDKEKAVLCASKALQLGFPR